MYCSIPRAPTLPPLAHEWLLGFAVVNVPRHGTCLLWVLPSAGPEGMRAFGWGKMRLPTSVPCRRFTPTLLAVETLSAHLGTVKRLHCPDDREAGPLPE